MLDFVENQCVDSEQARKREILALWMKASQAFKMKPPDTFETVSIQPVDRAHGGRLEAIAKDKRFTETFRQLPTEFGMVEIDKLVAVQTNVVLGYVEKLIKEYPRQPTLEDLIEICLSLDKTVPEVAEMRLAENAVIYSSENTDLRFLGAIRKPLDQVDMQASSTGGIPTKGLLLLFGYGGSPVNVLEIGKRVFLNNGFHRVFALRRLGVTHIPVVVQKVSNPDLEFPAVYQGVPKGYLLRADRLPTLEDYLNPDMSITLRTKPRRRGVKVMWGSEQIDVPL